MNSRFVIDFPTTNRFPKTGSFIHLQGSRLPRGFACTRVGVINPPPGPLALAFTAMSRNARRKMASLLLGRSRGGQG